MKKIILIPFLIFIVASASAQSKFRLNGYASYVFDDSFDEANDVNTYFKGKVKGGLQWGGGLEFFTNPNYSVELIYLNKSTTAPVEFRAGLANPKRTENFDVSLHHILLAGNRFQQMGSGKVEGFGGLMLGVLISDVEAPSNGQSGSNTTFAWGGRVGTNIWMSDRIGLKLQAQILASTKATGGDLYFSYYGPVVLEDYTTLWQFGLGGGLTFRIGK
jgi:hypothetical protein